MPRPSPDSVQDAPSELFGGIMSGTSLDGVDVAILEVAGDAPERVRWRLVAFDSIEYPPDRRTLLRNAIASGGARELALLHRELGQAFAGAFLGLLDREGLRGADIRAIGSHGQTVWHEPPDASGPGVTLQLGDGATLAERVGCDVVCDLRSRDMAAGGQGAPLVPWADWVLLRREGVGRTLQNLGGMGNVTYLPPGSGEGSILGFDTGPGVALIDGAALRASNGEEPWDRDGVRAARGRVRRELLEALMADPFFDTPPPRSTGRERFGDARLEAILTEASPASDADWDDLLATLTEWTASSVASAYDRFLPVERVDEVVLTGGGAKNPTLVEAIARRLAPIPVRTGAAALGIDPDAKEAAAFALLAWAHLRGFAGNVPGATGAAGPRILGTLVPGGEHVWGVGTREREREEAVAGGEG